MSGYDAFVICTSPRSGSTLLCKLLAATGISGNPGSYFHDPSLDAWEDYFGLPQQPSRRKRIEAVIARALDKGTKDTGMFGLRLQRGSFDFFMQSLALLHPDATTDIARIEATFGSTCFIHLTRTDKVEQAVSLVRAEQSGLWHRAPDGREIERLAAPQDPTYDAARIAEAVDTFETYDADWHRWFEAQAVAPMRVTYDALARDPTGVLSEILGALALDRTRAESVLPEVAKLADATNRDWVARFRAEAGASSSANAD